MLVRDALRAYLADSASQYEWAATCSHAIPARLLWRQTANSIWWKRLVKSVAVDSGPLLALFDRVDIGNQPVLAWLAADQRIRLLTTWPLVTEVCALLARRVGEPAMIVCTR